MIKNYYLPLLKEDLCNSFLIWTVKIYILWLTKQQNLAQNKIIQRRKADIKLHNMKDCILTKDIIVILNAAAFFAAVWQ